MANLAIGDQALGFDLPGVDGTRHTLETVSEGREATAVVFLCNHCPYVLAWLNRLVDIANDYSGRGVTLVGINPNDAAKYPADSFEGMKTLAEEYALPFPYLHDETQDVAAAYGAERTPEVFLFDKSLALRYHGAPDDNHDADLAGTSYLRDAIEALLRGSEPPVARTAPVGCTVKWKAA